MTRGSYKESLCSWSDPTPARTLLALKKKCDNALSNLTRPVNPAHPYFITASAVKRARIFTRDTIRRIMADSLNMGLKWKR
ncbi:MAG: hypothetical protein L6435_06420 [Anaerolineae bacterium]|nr:hypothetical protein [Anaerolineae bacterium]